MALQLSNSLASALSSALQNPNIKYQEKSSLDDVDRRIAQEANKEVIAASKDARSLARQSAVATEKLNFENSLLNRAKLPQESQRLAVEHMKALTNLAQLDENKAKNQSSVLAKYGVMAYQNPKIAGQLREDFLNRFGYDPGDLGQKANALAAAAADEAFSKGIAEQVATSLDPELKRKAEAARLQEIGQGRRIIGAIEHSLKILEKAPNTAAGFLGDILSKFGGTAATDLAASLSTVQAAEAFGALQTMRANSPTGGALGQVSERELALLQNAYAALVQKSSPRELKRNLKIMRNRYLDIVFGEGSGPEREKIDGETYIGTQSLVAMQHFNESNKDQRLEVKQFSDGNLYVVDHKTQKTVRKFDGLSYYKDFVSEVNKQ